MPRQVECVQIFDEVRQIDIAWLREEGLLKPNRCIRGWPLGWKGGSRVTVDIDTFLNYLIIKQGFGSGERVTTVLLERRKSNLGKGEVWYFVCPVTGRLCRKLYGIDGSFLSRHAYPKGMYRSQTEPKSDRRLRRFITLHGTLKQPKAEWDFSNRKKYRTHYKGKPTKRYLDYLNRKRKLEALCTRPILAPIRFEIPRFY